MTTKELSDLSLKPIIDYVDAHFGSKMRLVQIYNEGLEQPVFRNTLYRWLSLKVEPHHGAALRLHQAFVKLQNEYGKIESKPVQQVPNL